MPGGPPAGQVAGMTSVGEAPGEEFRSDAQELAGEEVRELSRLSLWRSLWAIASVLAGAAAVVAAAAWSWHPLVVAAAAIAIASRQHAIAVLTHEAAHYRLLP